MKNLPAHLFHQTLTICIFGFKYKIHYRDNEELIKTLVIEQIQREVDLVNKGWEIMKNKRFRLVCEEWSPSGELSPTLKLRRNIIYKNMIISCEKYFNTRKMMKMENDH